MMRTEADGFESGNQERRKLIEVAAIETCSLPRSLAAAHRGFAFYLADPSARLTTIAKAVRMSGAIDVQHEAPWSGSNESTAPAISDYFVYAGTSGSSREQTFLVQGTNQRGCRSRENLVKIFKKGLDAISFFAAKGGSPICVYAHTRREKTN